MYKRQHNDTFIVSGSEGVDITPGIGADTINLSAGSGADIIRYNTLNDIGDTIVGFVSGSDSIHLNHSAVPVTNSNDFTGVLPEEVFVKGASAVALDADDLIIFDTSNNRLLFDADANGAGAAVTIATFDNSSLIHSDITIF